MPLASGKPRKVRIVRAADVERNPSRSLKQSVQVVQPKDSSAFRADKVVAKEDTETPKTAIETPRVKPSFRRSCYGRLQREEKRSLKSELPELLVPSPPSETRKGGHSPKIGAVSSRQALHPSTSPSSSPLAFHSGRPFSACRRSAADISQVVGGDTAPHEDRSETMEILRLREDLRREKTKRLQAEGVTLQIKLRMQKMQKAVTTKRSSLTPDEIALLDESIDGISEALEGVLRRLEALEAEHRNGRYTTKGFVEDEAPSTIFPETDHTPPSPINTPPSVTKSIRFRNTWTTTRSAATAEADALAGIRDRLTTIVLAEESSVQVEASQD